MIPAPTRYARATDVDHALELLGEPDAKAIAGGQSLIPVMKLRVARPSLVVDISRLELRGIEERDDEVHIGPLTTWSELASAELPAGLEAIAECARGIGDLQVRNLGTIGGSVVHADPASDMPAVLLALGAHARGSLRRRRCASLPSRTLLLGPFTTALGPQELVTDVVVPVPSAGSGSAYASVEHPASGFALVGAAALVGPDGRDGGSDRCRRDAVRPRRGSRDRRSRRRDLRRPLRVGGVPPRARRRARRARARDALGSARKGIDERHGDRRRPPAGRRARTR